MSKSRRSNPVDYKLPLMKSWDGNPKAFKPYQKRVKLICESFMRRIKAAYKRRLARIPNHASLKHYTKKQLDAYELQLAQEACEAEDGVNKLYTMLMEYLTPDRLGWGGGPYDVRNRIDVANDYIKHANDTIKRGHVGIKEYEHYAYKDVINSSKYHDERTDREQQLAWAKQNREYIRKLYLSVRQRFPYVREKYRNRMMKLAIAEVASGNKHGRLTEQVLTMTDLLKIGVPAVDIVGPWWPRTPDIKSPMDYIDFTDRHSDIRILTRPDVTRGVTDRESPSHDDWLHIIGLDGGDRELKEACFQYYLRHKAAPSVKWAQERSNQLEEERSKKEVEGQIPDVTKWLKYSKIWRDKGKVVIPIMPGPEWKVLGPQDARKLCETAKRDGLCVVDVITEFIHPDTYDTEDEDTARQLREDEPRDGSLSDGLRDYCHHEGVVTLVLCTDPKRRTVVGLDDNGECTSEHHCTGVQNEVDKQAWEYFREK
jgi:hypothetical protein